MGPFCRWSGVTGSVPFLHFPFRGSGKRGPIRGRSGTCRTGIILKGGYFLFLSFWSLRPFSFFIIFLAHFIPFGEIIIKEISFLLAQIIILFHILLAHIFIYLTFIALFFLFHIYAPIGIDYFFILSVKFHFIVLIFIDLIFIFRLFLTLILQIIIFHFKLLFFNFILLAYFYFSMTYFFNYRLINVFIFLFSLPTNFSIIAFLLSLHF